MNQIDIERIILTYNYKDAAKKIFSALHKPFSEAQIACILTTARMAEKKKLRIDEGELISILSDPKYWCPSKKEQWKRTAKAILESLGKTK